MTGETVEVEKKDDDEVELDPLKPSSEIETKTTEESSTSVETKDDKPTETETVDPVQKRINKITAEKHEARREASVLRERVAELEGNKKPEELGEPPKLEDFDFDEAKHNEAMIDYKVNQRFADQATQDSQKTAEDVRRSRADDFTAKEAEFSAKTEGYAEAVQKIPQLPPETLDTIYSMENGPQMAHYLGTHLDVADEIANAPPMVAAVRLGQIAAGFAAPTKTVEKTSAPKPVDTLAGAGGGVGKDLDDMSMDEIMHMD
jgi:hypothetical protein